jgi:hypothetical protein
LVMFLFHLSENHPNMAPWDKDGMVFYTKAIQGLRNFIKLAEEKEKETGEPVELLII